MGKIIISVVIIFIFGLIFFLFLSMKNAPITSINPTPTPPEERAVRIGMANPASLNCEKVGGTLTIRKRGDGGEYGLCTFEDDMACEEWALYRKECPMGGVKTTGFDTENQKYCVWIGGQTLAVEDAQCTLPKGEECPTDDLFNGICNQDTTELNPPSTKGTKCNVDPDENNKCPEGCVNFGVPLGCVTEEFQNYCDAGNNCIQ